VEGTLYRGDGRVVAVGWGRVLEWLDMWASTSYGPSTWAILKISRAPLHTVLSFTFVFFKKKYFPFASKNKSKIP
jgi:hypothetical protein